MTREATAGGSAGWNPFAPLRTRLDARMAQWIRRRQGSDRLPVRLERRRLYILPTRARVPAHTRVAGTVCRHREDTVRVWVHQHRGIGVNPGPDTEQPERMRGGEPQPLDAYHAAAGCRQWQLEPLPRPRREVGQHHRPLRERGLEAHARDVVTVAESELQRARGPRKHCGRDGRDHLGAEEIAVALLHRDEREAREEEGEKQCEAVRVVQSREQHEEQQCRERQPGTGGQNVEPASLERHRQAIGPLAAAHPLRHAGIQPAGERCEGLPPR